MPQFTLTMTPLQGRDLRCDYRLFESVTLDSDGVGISSLFFSSMTRAPTRPGIPPVLGADVVYVLDDDGVNRLVLEG